MFWKHLIKNFFKSLQKRICNHSFNVNYNYRIGSYVIYSYIWGKHLESITLTCSKCGYSFTFTCPVCFYDIDFKTTKNRELNSSSLISEFPEYNHEDPTENSVRYVLRLRGGAKASASNR